MNAAGLTSKKDALVKVAGELLESGGYGQLKIAEVAEAASVSMSTIYALFGSKEGLYIAYVEMQLKQFFDELLCRCDGVDDPAERLRIYIVLKFEHMGHQRKLVELGMQNNPLFFQSLLNEFNDILEPVHRFLTDNFRRLQPGTSDTGALLNARLFNGFANGCFQHWIEVGGDTEALAGQVCRQFICMMQQCGGSTTREEGMIR
ncbi:TetR/AcrR family transcriptional regulator [Sulfurimonas sp. HSL3-7]|uniref:TetR/AcrR family transcriptional regulator n=1 Tax=Sulfonitrofixus jiaomeiensis TaxID=3131938 RepID=UPI0031F904BB